MDRLRHANDCEGSHASATDVHQMSALNHRYKSPLLSTTAVLRNSNLPNVRYLRSVRSHTTSCRDSVKIHNSRFALLAAIQPTMPRTQTQTRLRSLYGQPETTDIPVLIGIERPPPDAYDKYLHLVPPHFCSTPALTNIDKVYTKYGNRYQKEKWRPLSIEAKGSAQRLYRKCK